MEEKKNILLVLRLSKKQSNLDMKYTGIINALRRLNLCVWYTYSDDGFIYLTNGEKDIEIGKMNTKFAQITRNTALYSAVRKHMKQTDVSYEYCYIRSVPPIFGYAGMLKAIKKSGAKIAFEIPTYPNTSEVESQTFIKRNLLKIFRKRQKALAKYIDVYLPMGEETKEINGRPAVNIRNGIETELLAKREYTPINAGEIHMLAIAKIARWHGFDRVIDGMKLYYDKNPETKVYFHIVGSDADGTLDKYKQKIAEYNLEKYVLLEGPKYGNDADYYFNTADIAIASINIQGMKTVYPLKIVEYLARGIPFVYAESQCQVRPEWDFCMSVPVDGTPIDIESLVAFSKRVNNIENVSDKMREIAKKDCSWDEQMGKMLDYFEEVEKI